MTTPEARDAEIEELWREVRALKAQRPGYVQAPVTAVDAESSTFSVQPPSQQDGAAQELSGISSPPHFLPDVGDTVTLSLAGPKPLYQPERIASGAVGGTELSADAINGKVITGATVQTAADGQPRMRLFETISNGVSIGELQFDYAMSASGYINGWLIAQGHPVSGLLVDLYTGQKGAIAGPHLQMFLDSNQKSKASLDAADGLSINGLLYVPSALGRSPITVTAAVNPDAALTGVITVPAISVPCRITAIAEGVTGNTPSARTVAWDWDSTPASATNVAKDDATIRVTTPGNSQYFPISTSLTMDLPAGVAGTFRLMYRSSGNGQNYGSVLWQRGPAS